MKFKINTCIIILFLLSQNIYAQENQESIESELLSAMLYGSLPYDEIVRQADDYLETASEPSRYFLKEYGRWDIFWSSRVDDKGSYQSYYDIMGQLAESSTQEENQSPIDPYCQTDAGDWSLSGPFVDYQWSGRLISVYAHPTQFPDIIYAGSNAGGLWKTTDGGATWNCLTDYLKVPYLGITDIIGHPTNPNIIYASTGSKNKWGIGILKSTDGGTSFDFVLEWENGPFYGEAIHDLEMEPNNPNVIFASGSNALYRTTDAGNTWTEVLSDRDYTPPNGSCNTTPPLFNAYNIVETEILPGNPQIVFASMYNEFDESGCNTLPFLQMSTDGGDTWTELPLEDLDAFAEIRRVYIATSTIDNTHLFVIYDDDHSSEKTLYTYNYINNTWQKLQHLNFNGSNNNKGPGNTFPAFEVNDRDPNIMYFGGTQMTRLTGALTPNPGTTQTLSTITSYTPGPSNVNHADVRAIHLVQSFPSGLGDQIVIGNDGGVSITENSNPSLPIDSDDDWININNTDGVISSEELCVTEFFDMDVPADQSGFWAGGTQDNGSFIYDADISPTWERISGGDGGSTIIDWNDPNILYIRSNSILSKFTNAGQNFSTSTSIPTTSGPASCSFGQTQPFRNFLSEQHPTDPDILFIANKLIFRRYDSNLDIVSCADFIGDDITCFGVSPSNPDVIYLAQNRILRKSTDAGLNWTQMTISGGGTNFPHTIKEILVHPTNPDKFWIGFGSFNHVLGQIPTSTNGRMRVMDVECSGTTCVLTDISYDNGLPPIPVNTLVRDETTNTLYCGTDVGVYKYELDNPTNGWQCFNMGLPPTLIFDLEINYCEGRLYAATHGRGVYSSPIDIIGNTCDCEDNFTISGVFNNGDVEYFEAEDWITSTATINAGADITYDSGGYICLNPGFLADNNAVFLAHINGCDNAPNGRVEEKQSEGAENVPITMKNYPNPFTGQTTIEFTLAEEAPVTLFVSDVIGRQVAPLLNGERKTEGTHQIMFDGQSQSPGIYYYTIKAGTYVGTQKMILVK